MYSSFIISVKREYHLSFFILCGGRIMFGNAYRLRALIFFMLVCLGICVLFACTQGAKYPEIAVTVNGTIIPYYTLPINIEKPDTYAYVFEQNPEMENLIEAGSGDTITVAFKNSTPGKVTIAYELLTVPYYGGVENTSDTSDTSNTSSAVAAVEVAFEAKGNKYKFEVDKLEIDKNHKYYWVFTPQQWRIEAENSHLHYIAGRLYKITAAWGENECEYAFVIKNRDDIGKDDMTFADKTENINVMLRRPENWQKIIDEPIIPEKNMNIIDGSTATIPITAELYRQFFDYSDDKINEAYYYGAYHNTTHYAYIHLIERGQGQSNPKSIIFVTPPSEEELQMAAEAGIELDIAPIAKDGFVFITHKDNPIDSLTGEQIRAIYSGEVTNWKELGGEDIEIVAYQREPNSGSQTAMEQMIMRGKKMMIPKEAYVIDMMGLLIEAVAEYENAKASIGYTYYYYINNLYKNENIKVLKIDGITPENQNLANETYPFTTNYYAVIRSDERAGSPAIKLRDFLVGDQGQRLVEMAGYCRAAK